MKRIGREVRRLHVVVSDLILKKKKKKKPRNYFMPGIFLCLYKAASIKQNDDQNTLMGVRKGEKG